MDPRQFNPALDWHHELLASTQWGLETTALSAIGLVVVLVLLGRFSCPTSPSGIFAP